MILFFGKRLQKGGLNVKAPTIKDVAKVAGVSVSTASRALNSSGYVSEHTREKVEKAIKQLNFVPNEVARSLYQKKSKLVGLLLPDISNPFFAEIVKGVEDRLNEEDYVMIVGNVRNSNKKVQEYVKVFTQNNVAGVLSAVEMHEWTLATLPLVMIDRQCVGIEYTVQANNFQGGQLAAQAIVERTPGSVLILEGPDDVYSSHIRLEGAVSVLEPHGIAYEIYKTPSFNQQSAEQVAHDILSNYSHVNSVIASNDLHALVLMRAAITQGVAIPQDIQIIGYDNIPFSELMYPGLTTISQPAYDIGYQGAEMLLARIQHTSITQQAVQLPVTLQLRESLREKGEQ